MKRQTFLILAALSIASAAFAGPKTEVPKDGAYWGIGGGTAVGVMNSPLNSSLLVKINAGGPFEEDLVIQGDLEGLFHQLAGNPFYDCRLSIGLKLVAPTPVVQPYLYHGYGASLRFGGSPGVPTLLSFVISAGAGFQVEVADGVRVFGESKLNLLRHEGPSSLDLPLAAGFTFPI